MGILPVIRNGEHSPWRLTVAQMEHRFGRGEERKQLMDRFRAQRALLMRQGIQGVQWVSGTFIEQVVRIPVLEILTISPSQIDESFVARFPRGDQHFRMHWLGSAPAPDDIARWVVMFSLWYPAPNEPVRWKGFVSISLHEDGDAPMSEDAHVTDEYEPPPLPRMLRRWLRSVTGPAKK